MDSHLFYRNYIKSHNNSPMSGRKKHLLKSEIKADMR